jgi:glycerate dehydrogenase
LGRLLHQADFVTLHAPLSELTQNLMDRKALSKMKRGAFLINMARGGLVDEKALYDALKSGRLAGAASDVLNQEPPPRNHFLLKAPNFLVTPHIAWASREARIRLLHEIALNIRAFQKRKRRNRVV